MSTSASNGDSDESTASMASSTSQQGSATGKVRTRFAPSPTGYMHIGGIRTAIFAWAYAKQQDGDFILRIEDTDKSREVDGSIEHIIESLKWLKVDWQEGPDIGGEFGPYKQSERLETYKQWAQKLIDKDLAYADPFTAEEVQKYREQARAEKKPFLYRDFRPETTSTPDDWYGRVPIRFKTTNLKRTNWEDEVRGKMSAGEEALDDFILIKADGFPTYNFAHVIDDYLMKISHVMRGEEFISSTPKFIALHEALEIQVPKLVTMPPILGKNGGKKLSKRDGAKDVLEYKEEKYLPEAMINFLTSLGWNDGTEKEIYSVQEFIDAFSLDRVQRKGAQFDETKLDWINWKHYELLITSDLPRALKLLDIPDEVTNEFADLALSKARSIEEFKTQIQVLLNPGVFKLSGETLAQVDKDLNKETALKYLQSAQAVLTDSDFDHMAIETALRADMENLGAQPRQYLNLLRWAVSNHKVSPNLFEMLEVIGKDTSLSRLKASADSA